ncbi:S-type anion channel SLAH3-like isoform X1 [Ipomoea triloba]|uniref:S-type anion channel SLAH3-like isoform X1 n=1 Tax=Ipomoea triloba TaxID=35885 RepID=UPI00125D31A8|nr:S-type anion channel SLAH3-like isoform X1 [Ipomoea triloba]
MESLPSLIRRVSVLEVDGFDSSEEHGDTKRTGDAAAVESGEAKILHSVSISMPPSPIGATKTPRSSKFKDKRFDSFKTWSGRCEKQISSARSKQRQLQQEESDGSDHNNNEMESISVDRYYDALEGPELDTLKASEEGVLLPEDRTWPFLLRFTIGSFGMCLGVSSQAILWKALATAPSTEFLHVSLDVNLVLWFISVALFCIIASIYALKTILYFEAVRREYYHPVRVNFFFAPWIVVLFLGLGVPPSVTENLPSSLWYVFMAPIFCLELKIYGQWMSGGQRRLSKVANPSNHLSIVGNFVGALLGATMGLREGPIFFFAIGLAHYMVLFVTLYQRLPTNETLPKELHPVFFLFVAAPSVASMAWAKIQGSFGDGAKVAYFIALFLYFSLSVRINFFRGFKFSLAWWAYTFPMTGAAVATIRYSSVVTNTLTKSLAVILSAAASLTVTFLLVTTIIHAFVLGDLYPNDIAIAICERRPKSHRLWNNTASDTSSDANQIDMYLKYADTKDVER